MRSKPLPRRVPRRPARPRPRPLLALRRHPRAWWAVVLAVAGVVAWVVGGLASRAEEAAGSWGPAAPVVVARHDLTAGEELTAADVRLVPLPRRLTPPDALRDLPEGRAVRVAVYEGEVLIADRVAPAGVAGLAATLPDGTRAVAIPVEPGTAPPLATGDRVDVLVALAPEAAGDGPPGFTLTADAVVVDVGEHAVTVAVDPEVAPRIAVALGHGAVSLALVGP